MQRQGELTARLRPSIILAVPNRRGQEKTFTERLLTDAGIRPGMRVLDLGCGSGQVTRMIANLVGDTGQVVGIDRNARAIARATEMAARDALSNVTFVEQDLAEPLPARPPFDAAVARRVLMYLPDPSTLLLALAAALRPSGLVVIQEMDCTMTPAQSEPHPLHDQVNSWIWSTIAGEGGNVHLGIELPSLLARCGFAVSHVRAEAEIEGHPDSMATVVRAILPRILDHTALTEAEIDVATLEQRLVAERAKAGSIYVRSMTFGVWATKEPQP